MVCPCSPLYQEKSPLLLSGKLLPMFNSFFVGLQDEVITDMNVAMSYTERAHLLGIALSWHRKASKTQTSDAEDQLRSLEQRVWLARLRAEKERLGEEKRQVDLAARSRPVRCAIIAVCRNHHGEGMANVEA